MTSLAQPKSESVSRFDALRARDFRYYWAGWLISVAGQQMLWITQGWLLYELTGSALSLGARALAQAIPATVLTLFGGVVADKIDLRRLLIVSELTNVLLMSLMAGLALTEIIEPWHIIAIAFLLSAVDAFTSAARQSIFPHLMPRASLPSAIALNSTVYPGTAVVAPIITGFLLAGVVGVIGSARVASAAIFFLTALGFAANVVCLRAIRIPAVPRAAGKRLVDDFVEGTKLVWRQPAFALLLGTAYTNMFWVLSCAVLFPIFARDIFEVGPSGLGLMFTAFGIGSLAGALLTSTVAGALGRGGAIVAGSLCVGVFGVLFTLSPWYPVALIMLGLIGVGMSVSNVSILSSLQLIVRNDQRGRAMGFWGMVHTSVRALGETQMAAVAAVLSAPIALAIGGGLVVAFALVALAPNRQIRGLQAAEAAQTAAVRQREAESDAVSKA